MSMQNEAVKWVVVKLQGGINCFFLQESEWSRGYKVTSQHTIFHGTL